MTSETMVELVFNVPENLTSSNSKCVFWNETIPDWSELGCTTKSNKDNVTCECSHLTSFAVLMFRKTDEVDLPGRALSWISYIGCVLSICCFIVTIITLLSVKEIRQRMPQKIMINLCIALLLLDVVFVLGIDRPDTGSGSCIAVAVLLHYFLLVSISWTFVEAISMYFLIIKVFNVPGRKVWWTAGSLAWGIPLVVIVALYLSSKKFYTNEDYCYVDSSMGVFFNIFVIAPIGAIIGCNFVIFVMVIKKLFIRAPTLGKISTKTRKTKRKRAANAIAISLLLGLTWIFGFLSFKHTTSKAFVVIFTVLNSFQGVAVFILFCVLRNECRQVWRSWFNAVRNCILPAERHTKRLVSDTRKGSDTNDISLSAMQSTSKTVI
ncbi:adhesion G-protein coupled receptor G2-like [Antedon mediterranea]|uniref:adhesion G-protein coupled receptor G2-like n=1 Tax=Antedon mediterranea TaxID=105859 RepID=UPI003AF4C35B